MARRDIVIAMPTAASRFSDACNLRVGMHDLWADHVYLTEKVARDVFFQLAAPNAGTASTNRLMANQGQIANALEPAYGRTTSDFIKKLLEEHITIGYQIMNFAWLILAKGQKEHKPQLDQENAKWDENGKQIATVLHNLTRIPYQEMATHMQTHLYTTRAYVIPLMQSKFEESQQKFDIALAHMRHFSDVLAPAVARDLAQAQKWS